ncbi:tol-pal system protein YbgF [Georhizobium profundi]|uniref:Cell division coordinator CpoB n=1 Tax=Georhizobium profundi TaxID=2341112 RepID=A0A3Q8XR01_9HYPH|nr:tol-pal system protein YbgF [Georhizobium profundi]AZN73140.1 tol-pal system protein YbgF [Georhizobium profundi]
MAVVSRTSFLRASVVALTAVMTASAAQAGPLDFLMRPAPPAPVGTAPGMGGAQIVQVQGADAQYQIGQLQEEIRRLNGRIEELGFQMLQIQEQMRQVQEDNEFRFQALEGGAPSGDATRTNSITNGTGASSNDGASADLPGIQPDVAAAPTPPTQPSSTVAPGETQLGSLTFDEQGNLSRTLDTATSGANAAGTGQMASLSLDDPDALYRDAYNLVLAGDYADAEAAFRDYIDIFPDGGQIADAHFWLGESQFSQGSFSDSARTFLNAHQNFPQADKAPEMLLKLGMSLAALDNRDTACATYREVLSRYPDAPATVRDKVTREQSNASC